MPALLGTDAGVGARGVDKGEDRQLEAFGQFHQSQRLAVALGPRHTEIATDFGLGVTAFLLADHHHRLAIDARQSTDDGRVIGKGTVAGQFFELIADQAQVVQRIRALRVSGELRHLPGGQCLEDLGRSYLELVLQLGDFLVDIERRAMTGVPELGNLCFQLGDGLFEIEEIGVHGWLASRGEARVYRERSGRSALAGIRQAPSAHAEEKRMTNWGLGPVPANRSHVPPFGPPASLMGAC